MPKAKRAKIAAPKKAANVKTAARVVMLAIYDYHIAEDNGKHGLVGIFDTFWSKQFPARMAFYLFVKFTGTPGTHRAQVELRSKPNGKRILELPLYEFTLPDKPVAYNELVSQMSIDLPGTGVLEWQGFFYC